MNNHFKIRVQSFLPLLLLVPFITSLLLPTLNIQPAQAAQTPAPLGSGTASMCPTSAFQTTARDEFINHKRASYENTVRTDFTQADTDDADSDDPPSFLYTIEFATNNLLEMAANCHDTVLLDSLSGLYAVPLEYLSDPTTNPQWRMNDGSISYLIKAQYLYLLARTNMIITSLQATERTPTMKDFQAKSQPFLRLMYQKSLFSEKVYNASKGCPNQTEYTNANFIKQLITKSLGPQNTTCNAVTDRDLWWIAGANELLAANNLYPTIFGLSTDLKAQLTAYLKDGITLIKGRSTSTPLTNFQNNPVTGYNLDGGYRQNGIENGYAGYSGMTYPTASQAAKGPINIGWDISHAYRFPHVFTSLYRQRTLNNNSFPAQADMVKYSNQLIYGAFNKDLTKPLFSNYMDGTNGWYRVGYQGEGAGYAPYDLTSSVMTGGYGFWAEFNSDIYTVLQRMYDISFSNDPDLINFRQSYYGRRFTNFVHTTTDGKLSLTEQMEFLPSLADPRLMLPSPTPTTTPTPKPSLTPTKTPTPSPTKIPTPSPTPKLASGTDLSIVSFVLVDKNGTAKTSFKINEAIYVKVTFKNLGNKGAVSGDNKTYTTFYKHKPASVALDTGSDPTNFYIAGPNLGAGTLAGYASYPTSSSAIVFPGLKSWTMTTPGTYTARVFEDYDGRVVETNESNNQITLTYTVTQ